MQAYEITRNKHYLEIALSAADFVIKDLHRTPYNGGFLFSYSPLEGNDTVFNASLLGSRLLSYCFYYTQQEEYKRLAELSIKACCSGQREDGAWVYGMLSVQNWVDSFHTGYNLDALIAYQELTEDHAFNGYIEKVSTTMSIIFSKRTELLNIMITECILLTSIVQGSY